MSTLLVENVDLHYGAAIALRRVSITVETGAVTCLMGRNGVGKTSLLRAITGAHPVSAGRITWDGADITRLPTYARAGRGIAWVPQGRDIFPLLTVRENLETGFAVLPRGNTANPVSRFSRTVNNGNTSRPCGTQAMPRRARSYSGSREISCPSHRIEPDEIGWAPTTARSKDVFPTPLRPSRQVTAPTSTVIET